jgi:hypothetical protein
VYGAVSLPTWGMLGLGFAGGLMWDALHTQLAPELMVADRSGMREAGVEIAMGWSIVLYAALCTIMSGFRPMFQRGRWEVHCLLSGVLASTMVLAEYLMITLRREPVVFIFTKEVAWRIGGAGLVAMLLSPVLFFGLNYLAAVIGYDPQPDRYGRKRT